MEREPRGRGWRIDGQLHEDLHFGRIDDRPDRHTRHGILRSDGSTLLLRVSGSLCHERSVLFAATVKYCAEPFVSVHRNVFWKHHPSDSAVRWIYTADD